MPSSLRLVGQLVLLGSVWAVPASVTAQTGFGPAAQNYAIAGSQPGDQMFPDVSLNASGGYAVWQDACSDGDGLGISARRLTSSLSGDLASFRINAQGAFDQEQPQVAMLQEGGAVFVWQSGRPGFQNIYARFLSSAGIFLGGDVQVSAVTNWNQIQPAVAVLADGNVVVVWTRYGDSTMQDVWAQRFNSIGQPLGAEFIVNSYKVQNQRRPVVTALSNGNFAVAWVTDYVSNTRFEEFNSTNAVTASAIVYCRVFDPAGTPVTGDVRVTLPTQPVCANPAIAALPGGGFTAVWNQKNLVEREASWDIFGRVCNASAVPAGAPFRINAVAFGDQFAPAIAALGADQLVVWSSLGQDGSHEGVYGRFLTNGTINGGEWLINTNNTVSRQIHPVVASDQAGRFLAVWTSFVGGTARFDLYAQRFLSTRVTLDPPAPPYVFALSSTQLAVSWPELAGYLNLANYELFMGNTTTPIPLTRNYYVADGLAPGRAYSFYLAYRFTDGSRSPLSVATKATTWGPDANGDGLPDTWQQIYWGPNAAGWPSPNADSDHDGANNLSEFLAGTDPLDAASVLRTRLIVTSAGGRLSWNTQAGFIYQVQKSTHFAGWTDYGSPRFAAGATDSVAVGGVNRSEFYRVIRVR